LDVDSKKISLLVEKYLEAECSLFPRDGRRRCSKTDVLVENVSCVEVLRHREQFFITLHWDILFLLFGRNAKSTGIFFHCHRGNFRVVNVSSLFNMTPCHLVSIVNQRCFFEPEDGDNKLLYTSDNDLPIEITSSARKHEFVSTSFERNSDLAICPHNVALLS
jgi:hypothetical protein